MEVRVRALGGGALGGRAASLATREDDIEGRCLRTRAQQPHTDCLGKGEECGWRVRPGATLAFS